MNLVFSCMSMTVQTEHTIIFIKLCELFDIKTQTSSWHFFKYILSRMFDVKTHDLYKISCLHSLRRSTALRLVVTRKHFYVRVGPVV